MPFNCIQEKTHRSPLHHICVSSLQCAQKIITVDSKLSLYDAFKKLIDHSILSAPVYSESKSISVKEEETTERKYIGVLDIQQLVKVAVFQYDMQGRNELQNQHREATIHNLIDATARMYDRASDGVDVAYLAAMTPFTCVKQSDCIYDVIRLLAPPSPAAQRQESHTTASSSLTTSASSTATQKTRAHRVFVMDQQGAHVVNVISQSTIIDFLGDNARYFPLLSSTIDQLPSLGSFDVISVSEKTSAIDAFRLMAKKDLSGIAVYKDPSTPGERKGVVIGNTSSSDLKLWLESIATSPYLSSPASKLQPMPPAQSSTIFNTSNKKNNSLLDMTIIGFLNKIRSRVMKTTAPVVLARPTDTVKKIILRLQACKKHRIFVSTSSDEPVERVVSLTDILHFLLRNE